MSDSSRGKRRRTPSPEESRRHNRHKRKRSHSRRRENNSNHSSVNEALTQVLASMQDMKKEFTAWPKRVDNIELQLNANSSICQFTRRLHLSLQRKSMCHTAMAPLRHL